MTESDTRTQLLDKAQDLVQTRGFNAFSYKDLSEAIGIRKASIHYHFASKSDLALALMQRYGVQLTRTLDALNQSKKSESAKLKSFIKLYENTAEAGAICMCGSLASDLETLPEPLAKEVSAYLRQSEEWIERRLSAGVQALEFELLIPPKALAGALLAGLQGALLVARACGTSKNALAPVRQSFFSSVRPLSQ